MKNKKPRSAGRSQIRLPQAGPGRTKPEAGKLRTQRTFAAWTLWALAGAGLLCLFLVYAPALHGTFLFDDLYLPFLEPGAADRPLSVWLRGLRPLLMVSFWLNLRLAGLDPTSFHIVNILLHFGAGCLVYVVVRRFLRIAGEARATVPSLFAAGVFLFHPVQTESVAYIASRSEVLSVLLGYGAFAVFLRREPGQAIGWRDSITVLILFALAAATKEHMVALPAAFLLTDLWWGRREPEATDGSQGGRLAWYAPVLANWRLYTPMALLAAIGLAGVWWVLSRATTAGFAIKDLTWSEYAFTQFRAVWVYLRLFLLPVWQSADYAAPISRTFFDHGAWLGCLALVAALWLCWRYRRRYPLAVFGFLLFLILLAPTSSVIPIQDPIVERRLYLPFLGLLLIAVDFIRRMEAGKTALAASLAGVVAVLGIAAYQRNHVWAGPVELWSDVVEQAPHNQRGHSQLAYAFYESGRCDEAIPHFETAAQLKQPDETLYLNWALALGCVNRDEEALERLKKAAALSPTAHVYSQIGMIHGKRGNQAEARKALDRAIEADPNFDMSYVYLGHLALQADRVAEARGYYEKALSLNPQNEMARQGLAAIAAGPGA